MSKHTKHAELEMGDREKHAAFVVACSVAEQTGARFGCVITTEILVQAVGIWLAHMIMAEDATLESTAERVMVAVNEHLALMKEIEQEEGQSVVEKLRAAGVHVEVINLSDLPAGKAH